MNNPGLRKSPARRAYVFQTAPGLGRIAGSFLCGTLVGAVTLWASWSPLPPAGTETHSTSVEPPTAAAVASEPERTETPKRKAVKRPFLTRPGDLFVATDSEREREYRVRQSDEIVDLILLRLAAVTQRNPDADPEAAATTLHMYQKGLVDGLMRTAPDLTDELADRIERTMCDPKAHAASQVSLARMVGDMPELANERTFDCVAERGKEDIVLWSMLDAWRSSGSPATPAIEKLRETATDPRTTSRFMSPMEAELAAQPKLEVESVSAETPSQEQPLEERTTGG